MHHYAKKPEYTDITCKTDTENAVVEHIVTIYKSQSKTNKNKLYTINMYHTQSKILTNGQHPSICLEHITKILSEVNTDEIDQLNNIIREKCEEAGLKQRPQTTQQPSTVHSIMPPSPPAVSMSDSILQESIEDRDPETENDNLVACPYCNNPAQHNSIECANCSQWIHAECEGLNDNEAKEYEEDANKTFICNMCNILNQDQTDMTTNQIKHSPEHTSETTQHKMLVTASGAGNSHSHNSNIQQSLTSQMTPTLDQTQHTLHTTNLKQPEITCGVGNSHSQKHSKQNPHTTPSSEEQTQHTLHTTLMKQPATICGVGNSHSQNPNAQQPKTTPAQTQHTLHTTHMKLPATTCGVGNSHSQNPNAQQPKTTPAQTQHTLHTTHLKQQATICGVGNSHSQNPNAQQPKTTPAQTQHTLHTTHLKLPATICGVGNSHAQNPNAQQPKTTPAQTQHTLHTTHLKLPATICGVGNSHSQNPNPQPNMTPSEEQTQHTLHTTHLKQPASTNCTIDRTQNTANSTRDETYAMACIPHNENSTQDTTPVTTTSATGPTSKTTKRKKKQDNFQLTDLEKQLAFCKSEIIRLENCCKEYQTTIQNLKLRIATT